MIPGPRLIQPFAHMLASTHTDGRSSKEAGGAYPWTPDNGDGTYNNPILLADYSDPDVIRHGDDFFMVTSSFNCTPGLPVLHSKDLVNWTLINHAIKNLPHSRYAEMQPGCGVWASAIRFHAGKFWIFFPTPDEGIYVTTATDPRGQWSEPHLVQKGKGLIDPCPLWDDDGAAYLVHAYAHSRSSIKHVLRVHPMAPDGSRLLGEGRIVFHEPQRHHTIEGPKCLKRDGWYYILAPAGGVENGWQVALRSRNIYGPYEDRTVLEQGRTAINGPHQGALVDLPNGEWWFVHFQDAGVYGRVAHLQPVKWKDGWPLIGEDQDGNGVGEPVMRFQKPAVGKNSVLAVPQTSDEFDSPKLGLQWQWHANHRDDWHSLTARKGWLRLYAQPFSGNDLGKAANLLLQKFPARSFAVETRVEFAPKQDGEEAGLIVTGRAHAAIAVRHGQRNHQIIFRNNGVENVVGETSSRPVRFRVTVGDGGMCKFSFATGDGGWTEVAEAFQAQAGVWIGAKVGLCSIASATAQNGHADFDYFRFLPERTSRHPG